MIGKGRRLRLALDLRYSLGCKIGLGRAGDEVGTRGRTGLWAERCLALAPILMVVLALRLGMRLGRKLGLRM